MPRPTCRSGSVGYEFLGGIRTVDVHMRRLRAKLGTEHEQMIGTVRNVDYKFVGPSHGDLAMAVAPGETGDANDHEKQQTPDRVTAGTQDDEGLQRIRHEIGIPCRRHGEAQPTHRQ
jgi:hypothetical protein